MLTIHLEHESGTALYEQIYIKIRELIAAGELKEGEKLPSERGLAANIQVSRNTVALAYAQLYSEGYISTRAKSGYFVNKIDYMRKKEVNILTNVSEAADVPKEEYRFDFSPFSPAKESFPYKMWERLHKECIRAEGEKIFSLGDNQGDIGLREAIADYLYGYRGFRANPENIVIGAGTGYLLQILHHLIPKEQRFAMENPAYISAFRIFSSLNRKVVSINLDESGLKAEELDRENAAAVYITPAHQFPTGVIMPIARRREVLEWADKEDGRYIIEDDHDSEFRYKGLPIPPLKEIDASDKVIYLGTFSRTIAPAIRIGFMILPDSLLLKYRQNFGFIASTVPRIEQAVLTEFISGGHYERHINKTRKLYKTRHDAMIAALKIFGDKISISGENAGMHLVVKFKTEITGSELKNVLKADGIRLKALSEHFIGGGTKEEPVLLVGYGNVGEAEIKQGIEQMYKSAGKYL